MTRQRQRVARDLISALLARLDLVADLEPDRRQDVALLAVRVVKQRDVGATGSGRTRSPRRLAGTSDVLSRLKSILR